MEIKDSKLAEQIAAWESSRKAGSNRMERRYVSAELRMDFDKGPRMIGYAAVFNKPAVIWPGFREQVSPGAFAKTIKNDDVRALLNHDPNFVLGRTSAETLTLSEDAHGLRYEIVLPDTSYARDLQISVKRKDISQSSFGFNVIERNVKEDEKKGEMLVTLREVKLFDVSPVTFPAYESTEVHVRMIAGEKEIAYLFEDSGEVIVQPIEANDPPAAVLSDEELFREFEGIMGKVFK
jgi:uncharacterized protein